MIESLYDFVCPICREKYARCPHSIREMLDAQAAEIAELKAELAAMEYIEAEGDIGAEQQQSQYDELEANRDFWRRLEQQMEQRAEEAEAEIERLSKALDEIKEMRTGPQIYTWSDMVNKMQVIARAAREKREAANE